MPSPIPGMDPYLESPSLWPDVHHGFIGELRAALNVALRPRYVCRVGLRVYLCDEDDPGRSPLVPGTIKRSRNWPQRDRRPGHIDRRPPWRAVAVARRLTWRPGQDEDDHPPPSHGRVRPAA